MIRKVKLVPNWRRLWRAFSMQANVIGLAIIGGYVQLPTEFKSELPPKYVLWAAGAAFAFGILGRIIDQPSTKHEDQK